jgi:hypothetical protein
LGVGQTAFALGQIVSTLAVALEANGMNQNARLELIARVRERIQEAEAKIIAQNEVIAALEMSGRDSREARAIRAQLWIAQETDRAELERLIDEKDEQSN